MLNRILYLLSFIFIPFASFAQSISPSGYFLKDSIQIGEPTAYVLSIKYPKKMEIVFPDSLHNFHPFELTKKTYFTTKSDSTFSVDSTIYYLSTFEIDSIQYLKLPVYKINEFDSLIFWTETDSVVLSQVVTSIPDSVVMVTNTKYVEVPMAFNYPYAMIGIAVCIIVILILWIVFGKSVKRTILLYRLKKKNVKFVKAFDSLVEADFLQSEEILTVWKLYLEKLKAEPFTKLTTKEIVELLNQPKAKDALMAIDRNIYGPKDESLLLDAYKAIKSIAELEYTNKVKLITNG
ncbi:MAG: hypothetical protein L3J29_06150 [Cyclobacteriaceae bacterium]|nr:hypothetical protein [Cyclobacteriaceae bacterium]